MSNIEDTIESIKEKLPNVTPTPPSFHAQASAHELKSRLSFGEPALTIFDVRDRATFQDRQITGAMCLPWESLQAGERPHVALNRDIDIYAETDAKAAEAARLIRSLGFTRVAELKGGLETWQFIGGAVEGIATRDDKAGADAYNVFSRLKKFSLERRREEALKTA